MPPASKLASSKSAPDHDTVILSRNEMTQMQQMIRGVTIEGAMKKNEADSRNNRAQLAAERKARMQALDEQRRSQGSKKSIDEIEKETATQNELVRARQKGDEEIDEVKYMNQVMLYSKCVTVRDAQVLEKKAIKTESAEEERRMDMMMELERLKALRMYEEREQKRVEDRRKDAAVIRAQIEEREQERLRKVELKQQEQDAMLHHIDRMKQDDRVDAVRKKEGAKRLMEDVALANAEQIRLKNRQREMEQDEEQQIASYLKDKERREQDVQDEQRRFKAEKELEITRLRSMQEKAQDKQAELDALRARRAQEAYERDWRHREKATAHRAAEINADLKTAREFQMHEKEAQLADQASNEKDEFERIIAVQKIAEDAEKSKRLGDAGSRRKNADSLAKQISEVEEQRKRGRREFLEDGNRLKADKRDREAMIDQIRQRKLGELESLAVPKQYRTELFKKKSFEPLRPSM
jgi:hypothetical protein